MMSTGSRDHKRHNAIFVYVVVIIALQVLLLTVALEAFQADEASLAWSAAGLSAGLFATTLALSGLLRGD